MPFISCKYGYTYQLTLSYIIEKPGKTLHLLKASSKRFNPTKKRLKIPLLGTIKEFKVASKVKQEAIGKTNKSSLEDYGDDG